MVGPLNRNIKKIFVLALVLMWPSIARAEFPSIPYERDRNRDGVEITKLPAIDAYRIEEAFFHITVSRESASGNLRLSGRALGEGPVRIPITWDDIVVTDIQDVKGGSLICDPGTGPRIFLLPDEGCAFQVTLSFELATRKDARSKFVSLGIAPALNTVLFLEHAEDICIELPPGPVDRQGRIHVAGGKELIVRFNDTTPF